MSYRMFLDKAPIGACPRCRRNAYKFASFPSSCCGWNDEEYGECSACGYTYGFQYGAKQEFYEDCSKGFRRSDGTYCPKDIKRHKRIRRKMGLKKGDLTRPPEWAIM